MREAHVPERVGVQQGPGSPRHRPLDGGEWVSMSITALPESPSGRLGRGGLSPVISSVQLKF